MRDRIVAGSLFVVLVVSASWAQPAEWTQRVVSGPAPRQNHAMAYDAARGVAVLFGGSTASGFPNVETWEWNGTGGGDWALRATTGPSARIRHAMAYDSARGVTVFFGGQINGGFPAGDTWEWNGIAWTNRIVSGPSARFQHAMAYDAARGVTVLFGGGTNTSDSGETWEWNGTGWTNRMVLGPSGRKSPAMAYDTARGVTVLFGGISGLTTYYGDTWEWNGTVWTQRMVSPPSPSPRFGHAMLYDAARGVTVLFGGGSNSGHNGETWDWNGTGGGAWNQRMISGPSARSAHAMAYDSARGFTVLFGGTGIGVPNGETWELGVTCAAPSITAQPAAQTECPGGSASFTVGASGTEPFAYQWRKGGVDLADEPNHIAGANAATLVIVNAIESDEASYNCVVTNACGTVGSEQATLIVGTLPGDVNCDCTVDLSDLSTLLAHFGTAGDATREDGDVDGNGTVDLSDLAILLSDFGSTCP